jgi:hypothetical protein
MVDTLTQILRLLPLAALVVLVVVAPLPRLRVVCLEALRIGPVSFGPIRFSFVRQRPRRVLSSAGPALLPSRSSKCARPHVERRAAKNGARAKRRKASGPT